MAGRIYALNGPTGLIPMEEAPYDSEKLLQELLASYPDLLAGEQIDSAAPRRWLLVVREMAVPGEEDGNARWSLDHLFLDQDAIPTLVEVKRSTDSRIRRKVVGQMLDYAANAVVYWPVEEIRAKFEGRCEKSGKDPDEELATFLGTEQSVDEFWQQVKTNLQAGRIRMVFVADSIPRELRRIVEFMNEQMDPAEVLAVEVRQFVGPGVKTLVPRVFGQTESAKLKKSPRPASGNQWNESTFMAAVQDGKGVAVRKVAEDLLHWIQPQVSYVWYGAGAKNGGIVPVIKVGDAKHLIGRLDTNGWFAFRFDWLKRRPEFASEEARRELLAKINEIPGFHFGDEALATKARIHFDQLTTVEAVSKLKSAIAWLIERVKAS